MFEFCLPTGAKIVPDNPDWIHEIKYDGYRLRVDRDGDRMRLITRGGYYWTKRYPWIVEAARSYELHLRDIAPSHATSRWSAA